MIEPYSPKRPWSRENARYIRELAVTCGISEVTARRWANGQGPGRNSNPEAVRRFLANRGAQ